jgi:uncharacterized C2H2 Zn-finger protein
MDRFLASCARCGSVFAPPIRQGPSGSYRIGEVQARCPHCGVTGTVRSRDATAMLPDWP